LFGVVGRRFPELRTVRDVHVGAGFFVGDCFEINNTG